MIKRDGDSREVVINVQTDCTNELSSMKRLCINDGDIYILHYVPLKTVYQ